MNESAAGDPSTRSGSWTRSKYLALDEISRFIGKRLKLSAANSNPEKTNHLMVYSETRAYSWVILGNNSEDEEVCIAFQIMGIINPSLTIINHKY